MREKSASRKVILTITLTLAIVVGYQLTANAKSDFWNNFNTRYGTSGPCSTCHVSDSNFNLNDYGADFKDSGRDFAAIEFMDSDGDGADNITEIQAGTFPGDPTSTPVITGQPPVADAGPDQTVNEGVPVTLNGSNSTDPDNDIASYLWEQTAGPVISLSGSTAAQLTFTSPDVGLSGVALTFRLTVTDSGGLLSTDTSIINVTWVNAPPTANTGPDQTVPEGATVTLDGSNSSDPDDGIFSYLWEQTAGTPVTLIDPTASQAGFTSPDVGPDGSSYTFQLTVTDNGGLQATDTTIVNVSFTNQPPLAVAGPDQTVPEGPSVTLDGSNSSDPDDGIFSYLWEQTAGTPVTLIDPTASQTGFTTPDVGLDGASYTFQLTVTDNGGLQATDTTIVNVSFVNQPPVAVAGPDRTVSEGTEVTLDGSNSSDPEDGIASYLWEQTNGTPVTLTDPTASQTGFTTPGVGLDGASYTFQLTVTDNGGLQATDTTIVNVSFANLPPAADAGPDRTVTEETEVTLDGSNSSDPDDGIASYLWEQTNGTPVTLIDPTASQTGFNTPDVGLDGVSLTFRLTVTDNGGLQAMDTVIVNISFVNQPPVAVAGPDQTVTQGTAVTLDGSNSSDPDDGIFSYLWEQTAGTPVTLINQATSQPGFTTPDVGLDGISYTFQLTVTDAGGLQSSDTVIVNVAPVVNGTPIADAGPDQTVNTGAAVILDGSASSDPDDGIASYLWTQTSGAAVTLSEVNAAQPTFTALDAGSFTFQLTVTDNGGLQASDSTIVNVQSVSGGDEPPIADAGPKQEVMEGETVTLDGSGSTGSNGEPVTFFWTQVKGPSVTLSDPTAARPTFVTPPVNADDKDDSDHDADHKDDDDKDDSDHDADHKDGDDKDDDHKSGRNSRDDDDDRVELKFKLTVTNGSGLKDSDKVTILVRDNGLNEFPDDVTSSEASTGRHFGIKVEGGGHIISLNISALYDVNDTWRMPKHLPYGLFGFEIKVDTPGQTVKVTFHLDKEARKRYKWFKYSADGGWQKIDDEVAVFSRNRKKVTLTLTDGGQGDEDGLVNGIIVDPSGLGSVGDTVDGESEKRSGCFISTL